MGRKIIEVFMYILAAIMIGLFLMAFYLGFLAFMGAMLMIGILSLIYETAKRLFLFQPSKLEE